MVGAGRPGAGLALSLRALRDRAWSLGLAGCTALAGTGRRGACLGLAARWLAALAAGCTALAGTGCRTTCLCLTARWLAILPLARCILAWAGRAGGLALAGTLRTAGGLACARLA